jgi:hypothetical protein
MKNVQFNDTIHDKFLHLTVPNCLENRPAVIVGDSLYVYNDSTHKKRYEAIVHDIINGCTLKLEINDSISYIQKTRYDVEFSYDKSAIRLMHNALDICSNNFSVYKEILFPNSNRISIKTEHREIKMWFDRDLNDEQKKAIGSILSGTSYPSPFILFGPPGTGSWYRKCTKTT